MASNFCNTSPSTETEQILNSLPPLPSLDKLAALIAKKANQIKNLYLTKIDGLLKPFLESPECPSKEETQKFINTRNNIVSSLNDLLSFVERYTGTLAGISGGLTAVLIAIKVAAGIASGIISSTIVIPFPAIPPAVSSGVDAGLKTIEGLKFKNDGSQKIVTTMNGLTSANVSIQVFTSVLKALICKIEALDINLVECTPELKEIKDNPLIPDSEISRVLVPISPSLIEYLEQIDREEQESVGNTTYKGFIFEIEEVPFSPTVNRKRANALNSDGVVLLQTELSFTLDPSVLIEELKLVINQDNLRAD